MEYRSGESGIPTKVDICEVCSKVHREIPSEDNMIDIWFLRADRRHVDDYIRIGASQLSRTYLTATDPKEVADEFAKNIGYMMYMDGRAIACVIYYVRDGYAFIDELVVEQGLEGKGVGTQALAFVLNELKGMAVIKLVTHPENPAKRLYERFGFRETGVRIEDYCESGEPRVEMALIR